MGDAQMPFGGPGGMFYDEEAAVRAAMEASRREQQQQPKGPPPASQRALRSLPQISICPQDLIDPVNRECCICLEPHALRSTGIRLPCAHIFHTGCIKHWLQSSCTCPVCRYELPTDDTEYEKGRLQRMKQRKPRFAAHELQRMPLKQLKQLRVDQNYKALDRHDLIQYLISSGSVEIIATPEPVEYSLRTLREMSVSELRTCMNDEAGVFFDAKDVVEKEDMIRIFLLSGRLSVTPEETDEEGETDTATASTSDNPQSSSEEPDAKPAPIVPGRAAIVVETVSTDALNDADCIMDFENPQRTDSRVLMEEVSVDESPTATAEQPTSDSEPDQETHPEQVSTCTKEVRVDGSRDKVNFEESHTFHNDSGTARSEPASSSLNGDDDNHRGRKRPAETSAANEDAEVVQSRLHTLSIRELRSMGRNLSIDLSDCIERQEMIRRLSCAESSAHSHTSSTSQESPVDIAMISDWSISDFRTVARVLNVDLKDAVVHQEMAVVFHQATETDPRSVHVLSKLIHQSVSQLRSIAHELRIDVSTCLEKTDILSLIWKRKMEQQ